MSEHPTTTTSEQEHVVASPPTRLGYLDNLRVGFVAVLITLTYLWRMLVPAGTYWPVVGLPTPAYLPQYLLLFVVGALAFRHGWFDRLPRAVGWAGLATAAGSLVVFAPLLVSAGDAVTRPGSWQSLVSAAFETIFATGIILFLLKLFQRRFDRQRRLGRFLSAHAYAVYFLHPCGARRPGLRVARLAGGSDHQVRGARGARAAVVLGRRVRPPIAAQRQAGVLSRQPSSRRAGRSSLLVVGSTPIRCR
jgi:hypothetical protein